MSAPLHFSPRRYYVDNSGQRVLVGLTFDETDEFEKLDDRLGRDKHSDHLGENPEAALSRCAEQRWQELYAKHEAAWKTWLNNASSISD